VYADVSARNKKLLFNYQLSGAPFVYPADLLGPPSYPNVTVYFLDWEATYTNTVWALRNGGYFPLCYFTVGEQNCVLSTNMLSARVLMVMSGLACCASAAHT
jgi:hypothetical protein